MPQEESKTTEHTPTLLPCPFCGGEGIFKPNIPHVRCSWILCGAVTSGCANKDEAYAVWNRRAPQVVSDIVMVPREPTREMWAAMADAYGKAHRDNQRAPTLHHDAVNEAVYKAMIAAAEGKTR